MSKGKNRNKPIKPNVRNSDNEIEIIDTEKLYNETNFIRYLELLKPFSKKYTVIICSLDTPCGANDFTAYIGAKIIALGTKINLAGKYRCAYAAIIHKGNLIFEKIGAPQTEVIEYTAVVDGISVKVKSAPYPISKQFADLEYGITVNNLSYGGCRGFSFVIFDIENNKLLDSSFFDVFPHIQTGIHVKYPSGEKAKEIIAYKNAHPEITVITYGGFRFPPIPFSDMSENEKFIFKFKDGFGAMMSKLGTIPALEKYFDNAEDIKEVITPPNSFHDIYGIRHFEDTVGKLVNTRGGIRITVGQPLKHKRTIFIVGICTTFGVGSADKDTIASLLQKMLNQYASSERFIVQNYGFYCGGDNLFESSEMIKIIHALPIVPGDIVVIQYLIKQQQGIGAVDCHDVSTRPHNYGELFFDGGHYTQEGNYVFAEKIFEHLKKNNYYADKYAEQIKLKAENQSDALISRNSDLPDEMAKKLQDYKNILSEFYNSMFPAPIIGAIVMNCNPFTLGHRYLIETAAAQVTHLMIFVVQEDRSVFPFDDRLEMVDKGVADLCNVSVIPSGQFIISSLTFSEYFNKQEIQDRTIDSSLDVTLFGREIAPCLNISVRFVGEEPFDLVTRQYNESMKAILPKYGIEVVEIPRKAHNGTAISASRVRELLKEKNLDEISKIVPPTTFDYLKNKFASGNAVKI